MKKTYQNSAITYNDGNNSFTREFNEQIRECGAVAFNHSTGTYQYIQKFQEIEFINEIMPWYFTIRKSRLPRGLEIEMTYQFDPDAWLDDAEVTSLWKQAQEEGLPVYDYGKDGEIRLKRIAPLTAKPTKHTVWFLDKEGKEFVLSHDKLLILPMIKYLDIARELIRNHSTEPFEE